VQVASFPSFSVRRTVSRNGGFAPKWPRDGKELFFISLDGKQLMAAEVKTAPKMETGIPRPLFSIVASAFLPGTGNTVLYDVTGDGRKFLLNETLSGSADQINVVLNWPAELHR
jgi:hypothetical protein